MPLFVRAGDESCDAIIAQNYAYPYLVVHELVESFAGEPGRRTGAAGPFLGRAGSERLHQQLHPLVPRRPGQLRRLRRVRDRLRRRSRASSGCSYRQTLLHTNPFTSLAEVGDKLFPWPQSPATEQERTYYNAALGLFLLIADTYGEQTIHYIPDEIARRETVDGKDLVEIANRVLGTDVRRLAEEFEFARLGVELERLSPALALNRGVDLHEGLFVRSVKDGGVAEQAGLKEKDVITAVGSTPVANLLDFELGLFQARTAVRPLR